MEIGLIGSQIQKFRKQRGLTQKELGEAVGVSTQAVSQWENGGAPDVALLPAIADRLGVTVDALFGREGGQVQDMSDTFIQWLRSLPEKDRLSRITRLLWEAAIYGVCDALTGLPRIDYPREGEFEPAGVAPGKVLMRTAVATDAGYILGVGAEDYSFFGVFPEPAAGYEAFLLEDGQYQKLFAALAMPGAIEILRYFCRSRESYYVPATVAQGTGLPPEQTEQALEALAEASSALYRREITLPEGPVSAYAFMEDGGLVALLTLARWISQPDRMYLTNNIVRKLPFVREGHRKEGPHENA